MMLIVDRAKCGVSVCVSSVVRSAALGDRKDFNVVLSQEGRAKNPALLIFYVASESGKGNEARGMLGRGMGRRRSASRLKPDSLSLRYGAARG